MVKGEKGESIDFPFFLYFSSLILLMYKACFLLFLFFISCSHSFAQENGQVVRGTVYDNASQERLMFASVALFRDSILIKGSATDSMGRFRFEGIASGRYNFQASYLGYNVFSLRNLEVTSGKEVVLQIKMEESVHAIDEVIISSVRKEETINEMSSVSTRIFSAEETQRYAGSRSDIARMAANFAGVQGSDDSRNDIVVRGNSPLGVLWRVDDVDIPNPNHFAAPGTTGGPVSALNSKMFGSSDFMTGAFPAEYGNATSGVFDLRMRNGNNEKMETTAQIGVLGLELAAEGPFTKRTSAPSFLMSYRYSTLGLVDKLNIPIGTSAVPRYQDAAFKLNFPSKSGKSSVSFFGIAGKSGIEILQSKLETPEEDVYDESNLDLYSGFGFAVGGINYSKTLSKKVFFKATISSSIEDGHSNRYLVFRDSLFHVDSLVNKLRFKFVTSKIAASSSVTAKLNSKNTFKLGLTAESHSYNFIDSIYNENNYTWDKRMDVKENPFLMQAYFQWQHKLSNRLVFNSGLHGQFYTLSSSSSIEPRAGLRWAYSEKQTLSFGYGMHSRMLPSYIYLIEYPQVDGTLKQSNKNLDFMRAHHFVVSHDFSLSPNSRIKTEVYYQSLYNVPVTFFASSYSMLNEGSSFDRIFPAELENRGTGENIGVEFTFEKFFSENYFLLATGSLFDSKYKGSDGISRNTDFNGVYAINFLAGKEFVLGKKKNKFFIVNTNLSYAGGGRYTPVDIAASNASGTMVEIDAERNTKQFRNYFRADLKLGLKLNTKRRMSHEIAIDLVNVFNTKNVLELSYATDPKNPGANPLHEIYQLGRLPLFYYRIDF